MARFSWERTLKKWSNAILESGQFDAVIESDARSRRWAGFAPASDDAIANAEARLGLCLPPSYKAFLKVSNGWWLEGTAGPIRFLSVEEIGPLARTQRSLVSIWTEGEEFVGDDDPALLPNSHLKTAVQISEDNDGFYLLNPKIQIEDGEYQCCFFATWVPGAECHGTFADLMNRRFQGFLAAHAPKSITNLCEPPDTYITDPGLFIAELNGLGYFEFCDSETAQSISFDFIERARNGISSLDPGAAPGHAIFETNTGRVVELDQHRAANERAAYAYSILRAGLAGCGVELGLIQEVITDSRYGAKLEGIEHEFFRLRRGKPSKQGGEHEINAARYVAYGVTTLVNKVLAAKGASLRVATLEQLVGHVESDERIVGDMRLKFVMLNDQLYYLLSWSPLLMYAKPMRPDIW